ncbi:hypothetical protein CEXT_403151 [Caerostris extrusa]|uniref:Uncharacterized protein n=1 Tax=Caerostris extrusa TaxID=172846 RepID=A0AAV4XAY7_CAEEX|nr:hypothetical protein CEXT_403151 [Caerostris extrusa]
MHSETTKRFPKTAVSFIKSESLTIRQTEKQDDRFQQTRSSPAKVLVIWGNWFDKDETKGQPICGRNTRMHSETTKRFPKTAVSFIKSESMTIRQTEKQDDLFRRDKVIASKSSGHLGKLAR